MKNIKVIIGRTNRVTSSQGYTYNEAGLTYNHPEVLYGGLTGHDILPMVVRSREIKPNVYTSGDIGAALGEYIESLSGLVAYYPLDETSGNAINNAPSTLDLYDGSVSGVAQGVAGQIGNAYTFNSTDKISVTTDATLDSLTAVSVAVLVNINGDGGGGFGRIIAKGPNAVGYWEMSTQNSGAVQFSADHVTQDLVTRFSVTYDEWVCLVFTYNGDATASTSVNGYINGVEAVHTVNQNGTGGRTTDSSVMAIGNRNSDTARVFDGSMQHVAVFNRELTASEALVIAQKAGLA